MIYDNNPDPYKIIASRIFDVPYEEVTRDQRTAVKIACWQGLMGNPEIAALEQAKHDQTVPVVREKSGLD